MTSLTAFLLALLAPVTAFANDWGWNMPVGVTRISEDIYHLHMTVFWICVGIGVLVFGVMIYSLIMHRKARGAKPAEFHENIVLELIWTLIPCVILIVMAVPATRVLIDMKDTADADVTIKVVGYQWKWEYEYLDENIRFFSNLATPSTEIRGKAPKGEWYLLEVDKPMVIPVGKKVRLLVTANDVIHSWWLPEFGIKRDAIPGFIYESWARVEKPGTYRGQCAELCGVYHGYMPIVVEAVSPEEYDQWVSQQQKAIVEQAEQAATDADKQFSYQELMTAGEEKYNTYCAACHGFDGKGIPPLFPALQASSVSTNPPISRHADIILNGISGSAMQGFKDQLTDLEIAAIVTYERNAWGNNTGDVVQPAEIHEQRQS